MVVLAEAARPPLISRLRDLARRFLLVTLVIIGALCGLLAVAFHKLVEGSRALLIDVALGRHGLERAALVVLIPAVVAAILPLIIRRFAPGAGGANLARVRRAYSEDASLLNFRTILATFLLTPLSLGSGAPLGPEGPTVVVASGFSAAVGRLLRLPRKIVRGLIPVGVAAGIAAIFNTPITGVVFALEEVLGTAQRGVLGGAIVASVAAAVVERWLLGGKALLAAPFSTWSDARELIGFAILGVVSGIVSGYSIAWTHRLKKRWSAVMPSASLRGLVAGTCIGLLGLLSPSILGVGYDSVTGWLYGAGSAETTAVAFAAKVAAFVIAVSAGVIGGTFAPSLFMGAALGSSVGHLTEDFFPFLHADPRAYALVGMGGFFAGLLRSPIAAVLIVVEVTRDYDLILPLMLTVSLAISVSRRISRHSVVEQQMRDEGYFESEGGDPLAELRVRDAMSSDPVAVVETMTFLDAVRAVSGTQHNLYPVVDGEGRLTGVLSRQDIDESARENRLDVIVSEAAQPPLVTARADERLIDVVRRMGQKGTDRVPVVDRDRRVVGFLTPSDILRARLKSTESEAGGFEVFGD